MSDIAVLFRSSFFSFDLEIDLNKANIPYIKMGGFKFVEPGFELDGLDVAFVGPHDDVLAAPGVVALAGRKHLIFPVRERVVVATWP
mgnify:CR=1 FL=1